MTQDQYGRARGPGYVGRGDVVPDEETEGYPTEEAKPMTSRLKKVASALRGDRGADQDPAGQGHYGYQGQPTTDRATDAATILDGMAQDPANPRRVTEQDEAAMMNSPISREGAAGTASPAAGTASPAAGTASPAVSRPGAGTASPAVSRPGAGSAAGAGASPREYRDEPGMAEAEQDEAVAVTRPDGVHRQAAEPDAPYAERQHGAAPSAGAPAGEPTGIAGRHAAQAASQTSPAAGEMRPAEATAALGDFSDLTYGNLIPDADQYAVQWQQIQFRFVDDPQGSVTQAADIVAQVTAKMEAAIQERQRAVEERQQAVAEQQRSLRGRWGEGTNADTEALRETLQMYKTFLDQLIGSRAR